MHGLRCKEIWMVAMGRGQCAISSRWWKFARKTKSRDFLMTLLIALQLRSFAPLDASCTSPSFSSSPRVFSLVPNLYLKRRRTNCHFNTKGSSVWWLMCEFVLKQNLSKKRKEKKMKCLSQTLRTTDFSNAVVNHQGQDCMKIVQYNLQHSLCLCTSAVGGQQTFHKSQLVHAKSQRIITSQNLYTPQIAG